MRKYTQNPIAKLISLKVKLLFSENKTSGFGGVVLRVISWFFIPKQMHNHKITNGSYNKNDSEKCYKIFPYNQTDDCWNQAKNDGRCESAKNIMPDFKWFGAMTIGGKVFPQNAETNGAKSAFGKQGERNTVNKFMKHNPDEKCNEKQKTIFYNFHHREIFPKVF